MALPVPYPLSALFSLLLAAGTGVLGIGVGERLLDVLGIRPASGVERVTLAGGLGLGALAYGFLALGLTGLLRPWAIGGMVVLVGIWAWPKIRSWPVRWRERPPALDLSNLFQRLAGVLVLVMFLVVLVRGLAPVSDYDGLTYHLVVPRDYLEAGRIYPFPGESHANFPLAVDLLYIPTILLGLESASKLIHLGFGLLMGLGTFALAQRLLGSRRESWLAVFVLATTPILGTVAGYAHNDLGWALFEFLAAYALLRWREDEGRSWLILSGIFAGLGLGSKYLGLPMLGVLGLVVLVEGGLLARRPWRRMLGDGLLFGMVAVVVAAPWYLKNWLWLGNPFYPLWFGGRGWDAYQLNQLQSMGTRYGPREGVWGLLLLPWDLYFNSIGYFGPIPFAFPPPVTLLLPLYLFVRRRRAVSVILLIAALRFGTWAVSARSPRYLMDIHPLLSVAAAYLLVELARPRGRAGRRYALGVVQALVAVLLMANLMWQVALLAEEDPVPVVLGMESREAYLADENDPPYRAIRFINQLPPESKVLFVGNGQSYYVTTDHVADVNHANWGHLLYRYDGELEVLHRALVAQGFTHIFYSRYDFDWQLNFDSEGHLAQELALFERFVDWYADLVYSDEAGSRVFALQPDGP